MSNKNIIIKCNPVNLSKEIKDIQDQLNISHQQLAQLLNCSVEELIKIEQGIVGELTLNDIKLLANLRERSVFDVLLNIR